MRTLAARITLAALLAAPAVASLPVAAHAEDEATFIFFYLDGGPPQPNTSPISVFDGVPVPVQSFDCPITSDDDPDVGPDGTPGTSDDSCLPSPSSGSSPHRPGAPCSHPPVPRPPSPRPSLPALPPRPPSWVQPAGTSPMPPA